MIRTEFDLLSSHHLKNIVKYCRGDHLINRGAIGTFGGRWREGRGDHLTKEGLLLPPETGSYLEQEMHDASHRTCSD